MSLTLPHTFASKTTVVGTDLDEQFAAIVAKFAAAISTGDMAAAAGILLTQLEASKEHIDVHLYANGTSVGGGGWPASGVLAAVPVPVISDTSVWTVTHVYWICNDTGGGTGTFDVQWGEYNAAGAWASAATVASGTLSNANAANDGNDGSVAVSSASLTQTTTARSLALVATGADATTISAAGGIVSVTVRIRRDISAS